MRKLWRTPQEGRTICIAMTGLMAGVVVVLAGALAQAQERVRIDVGDDRVDSRAIVEQWTRQWVGETRSLSQPGAARVSLMLRVEFAFGSSGLTGQAAKSLEKVAGALNDPKRGAAGLVEGHTDAIGTDENNTRFSRQRAAGLVAYISRKKESRRTAWRCPRWASAIFRPASRRPERYQLPGWRSFPPGRTGASRSGSPWRTR